MKTVGTTTDETISSAEKGSIRDVIVDEPVEEKAATQSRSSWWHSHAWAKWTILGTLTAGAIATIIGVPVAVTKNDDSDSDSVQPDIVNYTPPFNEEDGIPILTDDVLDGYGSIQEFETALEAVAKSYLDGVVGQSLEAPGFSRFGMAEPRDDVMVEAAADTNTRSGATPTSGAAAYDGVNDYNVNDQESGVNEGDRVVTDGNVAVAAYGEYLVGWNVTNGKSLLKMKLEDISVDSYPKPYIHTLLIKGDSLVVAVGNYGYPAQRAQTRVLTSFRNTRILVYDLRSIGNNPNSLTLIAQRDINGNFISLRAIGDAIHFVTSSEINWYHFFFAPFTRHGNSMFERLSADGYSQEVRRTASAKNIPEFINRTTEEILECGALPRLVRLNRWTTGNSSDPAMDHFLYNFGYARSMVIVSSFNLTQVEQEGSSALECVDVSGAFFPSSSWNTNLYSAKDTMIMAVQGNDYSDAREMFIDTTYLVAFDIAGATTGPKSLGHVEGYVLNPYSFRVEGSVLEIATTIRQAWRWITVAVAENGPRRRLQTNVPITENYIITMDLEGVNGTIREMDRISLGKEGEVFTTVRFYENKVTSENIGYAVTFRQMDPFYVFNTTNPNAINITGELDNITGWSSYLEPMNDDISIMLAIGQESDLNGRPLGVSISVFDATDLSNVHVADRLLIQSTSNVWSSDSEGLRDKNAVRFNQETGLLILPLRLYGHGNSYFRGFRVFTATPDKIVENKTCVVDHSTSIDRYSYSPRSLEPRSMIIAGSYMSTMGSQVVMMDLDTCNRDWELTV